MPQWMEDWMNYLRRDFVRLVSMVLIGAVLVFYSDEFARWVGQPALSPWGLFTGGTFWVVALTHIIRRLMFDRVDLQSVAEQAGLSSTGAGLVFLGVCVVLAAIVLTMGAAIRV